MVIGGSLGGLDVLSVLLSQLPADLGVPIVIVQHRSVESTEALVTLVQKHCALPVSEPDDKQPIEAARVYLAPPDYHLLIGRSAPGVHGAHRSAGQFELSTEAPVHHARPSIDVLLSAAAWVYGPATIGILLTGSSRDGAAGARAVQGCGGHVFIQDPTTAKAPHMPRAAMAATKTSRGHSPSELALALIERLNTLNT